MAYANLSQLKALLASPDTASDAVLTDTLARVTAWVDREMATIRDGFVSFEAVTQTRHLTGRGGRILHIPDLLAVTSLKFDSGRDGTFATTLTGTDYWLPDQTPYRAIELATGGNYSAWPTAQRGIRIIGSWGYAVTCPADVTMAVLEEAVRVFTSKAAGFSDAVGTEEGGGGVVYTRALSARTRRVLQAYHIPVLA